MAVEQALPIHINPLILTPFLSYPSPHINPIILTHFFCEGTMAVELALDVEEFQLVPLVETLTQVGTTVTCKHTHTHICTDLILIMTCSHLILTPLLFF